MVPPQHRLTETFGVGFGAVGVGGLVVAAGYLIEVIRSGLDDLDSLKYFGIALVVGLPCGAYEIYRRLNPTTLVPGQGQLGIYRGGKLDRVIPYAALTEFRLRITNTIREIFAFGMLGLFGLFGAFAAMGDAATTGATLGLAWAVAVGVTCLSGLGSAIWVRTLARHYIVPKGNGSETIVLKKAELRAVGWHH